MNENEKKKQEQWKETQNEGKMMVKHIQLLHQEHMDNQLNLIKK